MTLKARRNKRFGIASAILLGVLLALQPISAATSLKRFEFTEPEMGVPFRIVLYSKENKIAKAAAHKAFDRIAELNGILSDYEETSELSQLSQTSGQDRIVEVGPELWTLLRRSQRLARETNGAFDITVGPFVELWRRARRTREMPAKEALAKAQKAVGYRHIKLYPEKQAVRLTAPDMQLDMGGIAKGFAVDEAMAILSQNGIQHALVSGGGDLAVSGAPPKQPGWRIGIAPLEPRATPSRFVRLTHSALATSGDMFQFVVIDGKRYSHIVDPRTGLGLTDHSLVHVIAPDSTTADSLATVVSVLGPKKGLELIKQKPNVEARITRKPDDQPEIVTSKGFQSHYLRPASNSDQQD